jgi:hypothetical protein
VLVKKAPMSELGEKEEVMMEKEVNQAGKMPTKSKKVNAARLWIGVSICVQRMMG